MQKHCHVFMCVYVGMCVYPSSQRGQQQIRNYSFQVLHNWRLEHLQILVLAHSRPSKSYLTPRPEAKCVALAGKMHPRCGDYCGLPHAWRALRRKQDLNLLRLVRLVVFYNKKSILFLIKKRRGVTMLKLFWPRKN